MRRNHLFLWVGITLLSQSCASLFYDPSLKQKNNTIFLNSNDKNYEMFRVSDPKNYLDKPPFETSYTFDELTRKNTHILFTNKDCYDTIIRIRRVPRVGAILIDLPVYGFVVDVFRSDFYKISKKYKVINLTFQKTNEYFERNIQLSLTKSDSGILNRLLLENPPTLIINQINESKVIVFEKNLIMALNGIKRDGINDYEEIHQIKIKFPTKNALLINRIDSVKKEIEKTEIKTISDSKDLFRLLQIKQIADQQLVTQLQILEPYIEKKNLDKINKTYDFKHLNKLLLVADSIQKIKYSKNKVELEKKFFEEVQKSKNKNLILKNKDFVSASTSKKLEELLSEIVYNENLSDLRIKLLAIEADLKNKQDPSSIIESVEKIYPNALPSNLSENQRLKQIKESALKEKNINFINNELVEIQTMLDKGEIPFSKVQSLKYNKYLTLDHTNKLENFMLICASQQNKQRELADIERKNKEKIDNSTRTLWYGITAGFYFNNRNSQYFKFYVNEGNRFGKYFDGEETRDFKWDIVFSETNGKLMPSMIQIDLITQFGETYDYGSLDVKTNDSFTIQYLSRNDAFLGQINFYKRR
jgi:hypothetical protein